MDKKHNSKLETALLSIDNISVLLLKLIPQFLFDIESEIFIMTYEIL